MLVLLAYVLKHITALEQKENILVCMRRAVDEPNTSYLFFPKQRIMSSNDYDGFAATTNRHNNLRSPAFFNIFQTLAAT